MKLTNSKNGGGKLSKKAFTLIELLAVIIILAIIALISTPIVINVIEKAKRGSAESSALGYIDAIEKTTLADHILSSPNQLMRGNYRVGDLDVNYTGKGPDEGIVVIEDNRVKSAKLCIDNYSVYYDGENANITTNNYCSNSFKVTLIVNGNEQVKEIKKEVSITFEITKTDDMSNMNCNNGATPILNGATLTVNNIFGDTVCYIDNSLEETKDHIDSTETSIVMLKDETLSFVFNVLPSQNITFDLNGHNIIGSADSDTFSVQGYMLSKDSVGGGSITGHRYAIVVPNDGDLVVTSGMYKSTDAARGAISFVDGENGWSTKDASITIDGDTWNEETKQGVLITSDVGNGLMLQGEGQLDFYNGTITSELVAILPISTYKGKANLYDGIITSKKESAIRNLSVGTINISAKNRLYLTSLAQSFIPVIQNQGLGTVNIKGASANECTADATQTTSGLCIYAEGDKNYSANTSNAAVANAGEGIINIDGGTMYGGYMGVANHQGGTINIKNGDIRSEMYAIVNMRTGPINICGGNISSSNYDLYLPATITTGVVNYSDKVVFTNGTNVPTVESKEENAISNYTGSCIS